MTEDELKAELKRWGQATVSRFARQLDGPTAGDHILAKQRDLGMKSKLKRYDDHEPVKRDGSSRRRTMAAAAGVGGLTMLPMWACDPVRAANDASPPHDLEPVFIDVGVPDELRWVDQALGRMLVTHPLRARILREEFTGTGTQRMKAARVERDYGGKLSVRQYRLELQRALDWMGGKRAA